MTPNEGHDRRARGWVRPRALIGALVVTGLLLLGLANAHLVYVAVTSAPDCVTHSKVADDTPGSFRAAMPAC